MESLTGHTKANDEGSGGEVIPVRVAMGLCHLGSREIRERNRECIDIIHASQQIVVQGTNKTFTYEYANATNTRGYVH